ncbi:hypothetical protein CPC08DRAFT_364672 [Agrocybe pediades]|nr:hypothetical protein CPC08DRAFT_364672 [Agrocybe pediades]
MQSCCPPTFASAHRRDYQRRKGFQLWETDCAGRCLNSQDQQDDLQGTRIEAPMTRSFSYLKLQNTPAPRYPRTPSSSSRYTLDDTIVSHIRRRLNPKVGHPLLSSGGAAVLWALHFKDTPARPAPPQTRWKPTAAPGRLRSRSKNRWIWVGHGDFSPFGRRGTIAPRERLTHRRALLSSNLNDG